MPETKELPLIRKTTPVIRYIFFGTYRLEDVVNGKRKMNEAKPNPNGIKFRNQAISGIYCHTDYKDLIKDFDFYNRQKPSVKNKATEIVLAWHPNDFDFHNKEDVYEAMQFARKFAKRAFPDHMCLLAAQFDTSGKRPVPHIHIIVSQFNMKTLKVLRGPQLSVRHLRYIADKLTVEYNHKSPNKIVDMSKYRGTHHRTPTPAEMSVLTPMKWVLSNNPYSQNNLRNLAKHWNAVHHDGFKISFKRPGRITTRRRRHGRKHRYRAMLMKSNHSHGWIPVSKERYFDKWCPGIKDLHNNQSRLAMYKSNWAKVQANRRDEIKEIATKLTKSGVMKDLYHVVGNIGNVDGLDDYTDEAERAGVIISLHNYTRRNGKPGQSIRYRLKDHTYSYSGYQFIKTFGQSGRKFNNWDIQKQIGKNHNYEMKFFDSLDDNAFTDTFNAVNTAGKRDLDTQLSVTPPPTNVAPKPAPNHEQEPVQAPVTDEAEKRNEIHDYYRTKKSDRSLIDKFINNLENEIKHQAFLIARAMHRYRVRTSKWLKKNAIYPLKFKQMETNINKSIAKDTLKSVKQFNKSLSDRGKAYFRSIMLIAGNTDQQTFKDVLTRQDNILRDGSYTPISKLSTNSASFAHSLADAGRGVSKSGLLKINHFLENDTINDQLHHNNLCRRWTNPGYEARYKAKIKRERDRKAKIQQQKQEQAKGAKHARYQADRANGNFSANRSAKDEKLAKKYRKRHHSDYYRQ